MWILTSDVPCGGTTIVVEYGVPEGEAVKLVCPDGESITNRAGVTARVASVIETLKGHPLFGHVTLTRSERSAIAALVTELLEPTEPA